MSESSVRTYFPTYLLTLIIKKMKGSVQPGRVVTTLDLSKN